MQHQAVARPLGFALVLLTGGASATPTLEALPAQGYARKVVAPHKGRPVLVNFWATWCDPCRDEMPALLAATAGKRVDIVLVSLDSEKDLGRARAFLKSVRARGDAFVIGPGDPQLFIDEIDSTWDGTVPYTLLYDRDGKIVTRLKGGQGKKDFSRAIAEITKPQNKR